MNCRRFFEAVGSKQSVWFSIRRTSQSETLSISNFFEPPPSPFFFLRTLPPFLLLPSLFLSLLHPSIHPSLHPSHSSLLSLSPSRSVFHRPSHRGPWTLEPCRALGASPSMRGPSLDKSNAKVSQSKSNQSIPSRFAGRLFGPWLFDLVDSPGALSFPSFHR